MKITSLKFIKSAPSLDKCPQSDLPEIAFVGRSNVGKSSLINTILNRRNIAKVSSTPGRTRMINFFLVNERFHLVDLPGYGYAKAPKHLVQGWQHNMAEYIYNRSQLTAVVLILDIRHHPNELDHEMYRLITVSNKVPILTLTKSDKLKRSQLESRRRNILSAFGSAQPQHVIFSSVNGTGKRELWEILERYL